MTLTSAYSICCMQGTSQPTASRALAEPRGVRAAAVRTCMQRELRRPRPLSALADGATQTSESRGIGSYTIFVGPVEKTE